MADWWLSEAPSGVEVPVVVYTESSSCNEFDRVEVDESSDEVVITAYVNRVGGPDCTADYNSQPAPVRLASPLGTRTLGGCVAPEGGLQAPDLPRNNVDCSRRGG